MERIWEIEVGLHDVQRIKLDWTFLNLEYHRRCENDSVTISDTYTSTSKIFCGYELPRQYVTSSNKVIVKFQSDKSNVGTGFKLRYQVVQGKFCQRCVYQ
jgi:hypothetical protein